LEIAHAPSFAYIPPPPNRILLSACVALALLASFAFHSAASACTAFQLRSKDGAIVYFRSMEFGFPFNSKALIVPRGTEYTGSTPSGKPGLHWKAQYGFLGLNASVAPNMVADGQNEKGLAFGMLYLPGYAKYPPADPATTDRTIGAWETGAYVLSMCANVDEAVTALRDRVYIAEQSFPAFGFVLPVHFWIGDASGRVVIVEFVDGKMKTYDNPLGTLTNSPTFDWQMTNLMNYVNVSPVNVPSSTVGPLEIKNFGQGSGGLGLPGDMTPASRFVRIALFSQWAQQASTADDTVNLGFHVLNSFDLFNGVVRNPQPAPSAGKPAVADNDITEWVVAHDRTNLRTYLRTYEGSEVEMIDLKKIDFAAPGLRTIDLKRKFAPVDITAKAQPLKG